jgi:hypothetical protein
MDLGYDVSSCPDPDYGLAADRKPGLNFEIIGSLLRSKLLLELVNRRFRGP